MFRRLFAESGTNTYGTDRRTLPSIPWKRNATPEDQLAPIDSNAAVHGSMLYLVVEKNAPNRKLVQVDLSRPDIANAKEILPATEESILLGSMPNMGRIPERSCS